MKILRYKLLVLIQFTQWSQITYPLPHFLNWILYMQWKLFGLLKVIKILWVAHTLVAKVYELRNCRKRTWKSRNIHLYFSPSRNQQTKYYTGKMKFVDINFNTKRLEQDIKIKWQWEWLNERDSSVQNWSEWLRKPDIAGVGFCEAKLYYINQTPKRPYDCMPRTQTTEEIWKQSNVIRYSTE